MSAVARDDTPPARYKIGEWMTRPISLLDNTVIMKAMSVTGENGCPKIENDPVEYYFKCVEGAGPDSGWIGSPGWRTPALPDGRYLYAFKIRDTSPQHNETGYSEAFAVVVSPMTGYHGFALSQVASEPEGTLVSFTGTVAEVAKDHYVVESGAAKVNVVPQTKGDSTDPSLLGKAVTVKGCVWIVDGEERVTWAEVK
jgi:hypothetical protein